MRLQRTESTSAVFVTEFLTCVKSTFSVNIYRFETQPYSASLILPLARSGQLLGFFTHPIGK